jgi:hypothetical protein
MDELPDLTSDADVDALMTRLRARLEPPPTLPARGDAVGAGEFAQAFDNLVAAHEGLAASMVRAMEVIVDTIEELSAEQQPVAAPAAAVVQARALSPRVRPATRRAPRPASRRRAKR